MLWIIGLVVLLIAGGVIGLLAALGVFKKKSFPKHSSFVTAPSQMLGYGYVNKWIDCKVSEWERMADAMVRAGLNVTHVELLSFGASGYYDKPDVAVSKFKQFAKVFKSRRITILVTIINWNVGSGLAENGKKSICSSEYNLTWFSNIVSSLLREVGSDGIILEAASEWGPKSRNSNCWKKAEEFSNWVAANWPGMKAYNKESRPSSAPAHHIIDYHVADVNTLGAKSGNKIVVTDTSTILNYLGGLHSHITNPVGLTRLVRACQDQGFGFIMYAFSPPSIDYNGIKLIGNAAKV